MDRINQLERRIAEQQQEIRRLHRTVSREAIRRAEANQLAAGAPAAKAHAIAKSTVTEARQLLAQSTNPAIQAAMQQVINEQVQQAAPTVSQAIRGRSTTRKQLNGRIRAAVEGLRDGALELLESQSKVHVIKPPGKHMVTIRVDDFRDIETSRRRAQRQPAAGAPQHHNWEEALRFRRKDILEAMASVRGSRAELYQKLRKLAKAPTPAEIEMKFMIAVEVQLSKDSVDGSGTRSVETKRYVAHSGKATKTENSTSDRQLFGDAIGRVRSEIEDYEGEKSGWNIEFIKYIDTNVYLYKPRRTGRYTRPHPKLANAKSGVICPRNHDDDECFRWACLIHELYPFKADTTVMTTRQGQRLYETKVLAALEPQVQLNFGSMKFPVSLDDVADFEELNRVTVQIFDADTQRVLYSGNPRYLLRRAPINLANWSCGTVEHSMAIVNISHFLSLNKGKHGGDERNYSFCNYCKEKVNDKIIKEHEEICRAHLLGDRVIKLSNKPIQFDRVDALQPYPVFAVADFEARMLPSYQDHNGNEHVDHEAISFSLMLVAQCPDVFGDLCAHAKAVFDAKPEWRALLTTRQPIQNRKACGVIFTYVRQSADMPDVGETFLKLSLDLAQGLKLAKFVQYLGPTPPEPTTLQCYACRSMVQSRENLVLEHCHTTGDFRGWACVPCNKRMEIRTGELPMFFHNLAGYDANHILKGAANVSADALTRGEKISLDVIPQGGSKFIQLKFGRTSAAKRARIEAATVDRYRREHPKTDRTDKDIAKTARLMPDATIIIRDSMRFMGGSLEKLAETLTRNHAEPENTPLTNSYFSRVELGRMAKKMIFPYEFLTTYDVLQQPPVPPPAAFYSKLTQTDVDASDHDNLTRLAADLGCATFFDMLCVYNECDVLLLADIMCDFRSTALKLYGLEPLKFTGLPAMGWSAMLRLTDVSLEPLQDMDMIRMFEKARRGGVCFLNHERYHNTAESGEFLEYLDMNSLYPSAMSMPMPVGGFAWVTPFENIAQSNAVVEQLQDFIDATPQQPCDFMLEVDIQPPTDPELRARLFSYPLLPVVRCVDDAELSDYQRHLKAATEQQPSAAPTEKLIVDFHPKANYVLTRQMLAFAIELGYEITRVHSVLHFHTSDFMRQFVDTCVSKRKAATSEAEKNMWKLLMNSVYGKSLEDVMRHGNAKVVLDLEDLDKEIAKPSFSEAESVGDTYIVTHHEAIKEYSRPTYIGMVTLDYSKLLMARFFYRHIQPHGYRLLYQDTDSFVFAGPQDYKDIMRRYMESTDPADDIFDVSDLNAAWVTPEMKARGKKELGRMKSEIGHAKMQEFCALRPKAYAFLLDTDELHTRAKGVTKAVRKRLRIDDYKRVLFDATPMHAEQVSIRAFEHQLTTFTSRKVALSPFYDKCKLFDAVRIEPFAFSCAEGAPAAGIFSVDADYSSGDDWDLHKLRARLTLPGGYESPEDW